MTPEINITKLVEKQLLPPDYEVISTHNNLVILSRGEQMVARIGTLSHIAQREDPGDIRYSHTIAWETSKRAPVVRPMTQKPLVFEGAVISKYPLMRAAAWRQRRPNEIFKMIDDFNECLDIVSEAVDLRQLDVAKYAQSRLDYVEEEDYRKNETSFEYVQKILREHSAQYPFNEMTESDPALVHGDLHAKNVVVSSDDKLKIIDLDSAAKGPRLYDLSSWRYRQQLGDAAAIDLVVNEARKSNSWNEESYQALIGWKVLSSMTHILRYEAEELIEDQISRINSSAQGIGCVLGREKI